MTADAPIGGEPDGYFVPGHDVQQKKQDSAESLFF
jgi:hypothetical protein